MWVRCSFDRCEPYATLPPMQDILNLVSKFAAHTNSTATYCAVFDSDSVLCEGGAKCNSAPVASDSISDRMQFPIASITKSFAAVAILRLRDAGKIDLHAPIEKYLKEWRHRARRDAANSVTVEHLLTHTAGLPTDDPWGDKQVSAAEESLRELVQAGPNFDIAVGRQYRYSNLGYMILGLIIAEVAGLSARTYIEQEILGPLGMSSTTFSLRQASKLAQGFRYTAHGTWEAEAPMDAKNDGALFGGLFSSAADLMTWARFFLDAYSEGTSEADLILSKASRREAQQLRVLIEADPKVPNLGFEESVDGRGYGYGLRCFARAEYLAVGHSGGLPGVGCHLRWAPALGLGAVAVSMCSYGPAWSLARTALDVAAEERTHAELEKSDTMQLARRLGDRLISFALEDHCESVRDTFAENFFLDTPESEWRKAFGAWRQESAQQAIRDARLVLLSKLTFALELSDGRRMKVLLTPEIQPRIQKITLS